MPGRFFDDLLEDSDKHMGFDPYDEPNESGPWKDWGLKLKAEPKNGVKMGVSREWESENGEQSESTATNF